MTESIKSPEEVAQSIELLPRFAGLTVDDLGLSVTEMMIAAIEADRAQRPALETWEVFEEGYPNDATQFQCDQKAAEQIARSQTAADLQVQWDGRTYVARKVA